MRTEANLTLHLPQKLVLASVLLSPDHFFCQVWERLQEYLAFFGGEHSGLPDLGVTQLIASLIPHSGSQSRCAWGSVGSEANQILKPSTSSCIGCTSNPLLQTLTPTFKD